jgi:hydroxymethylpyrimidine pyrophosphatase-like HAD family hydrolase
MPLDAAHQVTAAATERGLSVSWFVGNRWLASGMDACTRREIGVVRAAPVVAELLGEREPPEKVLVMTPPERVHLLAELTAGLPAELSAQVSNPTYLEVTACGVDKGAAVATLAARLGLSPAEVLAIGDGPNDLSMLTFAGVSAAPANARPEVLAAADFVAPSNLENGVGRILDAIRPTSETSDQARRG